MAPAPPRNKEEKPGNRLPYDLLIDIISRIPARFLPKFKSVSKEWQTMLIDPAFVKLCRDQSKKNRRIFCMSETNGRGMHFSSIDLFGSWVTTNPSFQSPNYFNWIWMQSFNGLIFLSCIYNKKYICNPSSGKIVKLPKSPNHLKSSYSNYAFGYLRSMNEYKLVHAFESLGQEGFNFEVLTIRDGEPVSRGCWKFLRNYPRNLWATFCACANGIMYYICSGFHSSRGYVFSLDMEKEEFGVITDLPDELGEYNKKNIEFVELNDSLCAIKRVELEVERYVVNIWRLIDRQKGNWRKEFVITIPEGDMPPQFHTLGCNFLSYIHEGELVFCSKQGIIVYNIIQDSYKREEESSQRLQTVIGDITFYFDTTFSVIQ